MNGSQYGHLTEWIPPLQCTGPYIQIVRYQKPWEPRLGQGEEDEGGFRHGRHIEPRAPVPVHFVFKRRVDESNGKAWQIFIGMSAKSLLVLQCPHTPSRPYRGLRGHSGTVIQHILNPRC